MLILPFIGVPIIEPSIVAKAGFYKLAMSSKSFVSGSSICSTIAVMLQSLFSPFPCCMIPALLP